MNALTRPFAMFFYEPIIQLFGLYMAFSYGLLYRELFTDLVPSSDMLTDAVCVSSRSVPDDITIHIRRGVPSASRARRVELSRLRCRVDGRVTNQCPHA